MTVILPYVPTGSLGSSLAKAMHPREHHNSENEVEKRKAPCHPRTTAKIKTVKKLGSLYFIKSYHI